MGRTHEKESDADDKPHQQPSPRNREKIDRQANTAMTSGAMFGSIPRPKNIGDSGDQQPHQQPRRYHESNDLQSDAAMTPRRYHESNDLQSDAAMTPGAFPVGFVNDPRDEDGTFDNLRQPSDGNVMRASMARGTRNTVPQIVAHLAPDDDVVVEGKPLEGERSTCSLSVCDSPKRTVWILAVLLLLVVGGIVGGIVYWLDDEDTAMASPSTATEAVYLSYFAGVLNSENDFEEGTPRYRAAQWIIIDDPMQLKPDDEN
jgi:hypothetical protein